MTKDEVLGIQDAADNVTNFRCLFDARYYFMATRSGIIVDLDLLKVARQELLKVVKLSHRPFIVPLAAINGPVAIIRRRVRLGLGTFVRDLVNGAVG